jgi:hypothetical protein
MTAADQGACEVACIQCGNGFTPRRSDQSCCTKKCRTLFGKLKVYEERREHLRQIKLDKGCECCGYKAHASALTFDHIDPTLKSYEMASIFRRPWAIINAELAKCRVLCANCHAIWTQDPLSLPVAMAA